ncbi:uncharacterized protein LOC117611560 [Osmia lignaria lignaria]|uniref:uncharacterized protein LOC117611560 n=1 Tax=Osmia lignaria lignaria TaxID=1437193 RepID=UPI00402B0DCD
MNLSMKIIERSIETENSGNVDDNKIYLVSLVAYDFRNFLIMLRGHFGSFELVRAIFNPAFRRNLSGASIRYAEDKDKKKADNVFSWLKDIFRSDDGMQEARKVSISGGPVTVLDYPETNEASLINLKFDQGSIEYRRNFYDPKNNNIDYEKSQRFSPRHHLLALSEKIDTSIRTIMGCTPRNTKPPIREPNMPEKQEKKDEKKEKKKKKPVIRMEGGLGDTDQNDPTLKAEGTLHDNLDINLRHQWGVRLPEEVAKSENMELQQSVGSGYQVPVYDMKNLQLTMSSSKDSESIDAKTEGQMERRETTPLNNAKQLAKKSESSKNVSPGMMTEGGVVDEDYNIPPGTHVDAEVTAWKELVLRSKVPVDPSKEQFIPEDGRQAEMLSIRPEAPRPKLDVQAVPTSSSSDETMNEEEDEAEFSSDDRTSFKPDIARAGSGADVQKLDSKKLHTGSTCFTRKGSSRILDTIDNSVGFVASQRALDFSTSTDSGWERSDQSTAKETEPVPIAAEVQAESRFDQRSSDNTELAENPSDNQGVNVEGRQETTANFDQQRQAEMDQDFRDSLNSIADREMDMEMSMNSARDEDQSMRENSRMAIDRQDQRQAENEGQLSSLSEDFQASFDYASTPYEDDFYPTYESMSLEAVPEKSIVKKSKEPLQSTAASSDVQNDQGYVNPADEMEYRDEEYTSDGNYIRIPGDPYPYSPEHFNKWSNNETTKPGEKLAEIQPSVRKLHNDAHVSTLGGAQGKEVPN